MLFELAVEAPLETNTPRNDIITKRPSSTPQNSGSAQGVNQNRKSKNLKSEITPCLKQPSRALAVNK
jgi:hypothetical protein